MTRRDFPGASLSMPALPASLAALVGFFVAAVLPRASWPLIDGDVWWHIRAGEEILATGAVPRVDTWSIAGAGREWTSQDWLANVLLAAGNSLGPWGQTGLSVLFGLFVVAAFAILWRAIALRVPDIGWASRVVWLSLGLALGGPVMGVRVQVIDLLMACAVIWVLWRYQTGGSSRALLVLPLVAAAWANLHAGWPLLFLLGGAVVVGEAIDRLAHRRTTPEALSWARLRNLSLALVASAAALAINPNGIDLYTYPFDTVAITALNRYVMEWFRASPDTLFGQLLALFVAIAVLPSLVLGWRRGMRTSDALILGGLTVMGYMAIRFLLITGPIGSAVAAVVLSPIISRSRLGRATGDVLRRLTIPRTGRRGALNLALVVLLAVLGIGVTFLRVSPPAQAAEIRRVLPAGAVSWLEGHDQDGRIFNRYEWGGYIGRHRPAHPIFMDGRADVYGDELLQQYVAIIGLRDDPQKELDRWEIDYAVFPPGFAIGAWFDASPAWQRVYADETAAIWVRRS